MGSDPNVFPAHHGEVCEDLSSVGIFSDTVLSGRLIWLLRLYVLYRSMYLKLLSLLTDFLRTREFCSDSQKYIEESFSMQSRLAVYTCID